MASPTRSVAAASASPAPAAAPPPPLLVVGCGVLGTLAARRWLQLHPGATVVAQTRGAGSHAALAALGLQPRDRAAALAAPAAPRFPYVLFCAPPSGSADYGAEVALAASAWWSRPPPEGDGAAFGAFVHTSSTGVYADAAVVQEDSPTVARGASARTDGLLAAEDAALAAGGTVLRLAGLYTLRRGAHSYYMSQPSVAADGASLLNLVSYGDAAEAAVAALLRRPPLGARALLVCDGAPVGRARMVAACVASGLWPAGAREPAWTAPPGPPGKVLRNDATRAALGWAPRHPSFEAYLEAAKRGEPVE